MKKIILLSALVIITTIVFAQKQTFDLTTFTPPTGWKKETTQSAVQFSKQDLKTKKYCILIVMKSIPGTADAKENFDAAWESIVKNMVEVADAPTLQPQVKGNGWMAQSGYASYQDEGRKGMALLATSTGYEKMVNIVALTNTDIYQNDVNIFFESIELKKLTTVVKKTTQIKEPAKPVSNNVPNSRFAFSTTNFDDGWISVEKPDWVEVTKGNFKVLIHHPNKKADAYNSIVLDGLKNAWDILVAPRYSTASNMEFKPITGWQTIEFAEADMIDNNARQKVHVVFFKMNYSNGSGRYLEFITPNKQSFENEFGPYHQTTAGWEKLENMAYYNRFAVAASDLQGKWTSDFSGAIQYVNANTGLDAGMDTHASVENFQFSSGNTYKWDIGVASGPVGNIKFTSKISNGKFALPNNWQVYFSDFSGKPRTFAAYFSCIKGLRILWLDNKPYAKAN